ncbi:MAG TPA: diiron oxygenase [Baekduia sp.]|jgi:hypothetical protein
MCGLAGLGIGCAVAPACPKALLRRPPSEPGAAAPPPRSPLDSWNLRSSVRNRPHPQLGPADDAAFPAGLVPVARHPLVLEAPPDVRRRTLARHLFRYLHFTAVLEHLVVNRTALAFAHQVSGFTVPDRMRLDAFKIYCDEAYHALVAAELATAVAEREGLQVDWTATPYFLRRLGRLVEDAGPELAPVVELLFVVCSETLISGTLSQAAEAPSLSAPVRQAIGDHAHDERRHHAYFAELLERLWPQLTPSAQRRAGVVVPDLIDAFLRPDLEDYATELRGYGFGADDVAQILAESYPDAVVAADRRHMARHTVRYFAQVGALEDPATEGAFVASGLLAGATA